MSIDMSKEDLIKKITRGINTDIRKSDGMEEDYCFVLGDNIDKMQPVYVPTGIADLDEELGGGFPEGAIITIHGDPFAGKSSLAVQFAANLTKKGDYVLFVVSEPPFNTTVAQMVGMDMDKVHVIYTRDYGEQSIDAIEAYLFDKNTRRPHDAFDAVIVDSINNIVPKAAIKKLEKAGSEGDNMAVRAKLIDEFLSRVRGRGLLRNGTTLINIVQDRANLSGFGADKQMSGGFSLKFNSNIIINIKKTAPIKGVKKGIERPIGHGIKAVIEKNNIYGYLGACEYSVLYGTGVDDSEMLFAKGVDWGHILKQTKKDEEGAGYRFLLPDGDRFIPGNIAGARQYLKEDLLARDQLRNLINLGKPKTPPQSVGFMFEGDKEVVEEATEESGE